MSSSDDKFDGAVLEAENFEMEEVFMSSVTGFVKARSDSVLYEWEGTVSEESCSAFYKFPESKSPLK